MRTPRLPIAALAVAALVGGAATTAVAATPDQNIVQIASGNPNFTTLVSLVQSAGLGEALSTSSPLTVFAPTNASFDALPRATVARITANPDVLKSVLTYHVAPRRLTADDVVSRRYIRTLQGSTIRVRTNPNGVFLNGAAKVTATDVMATNSVIHVIDHVLIPRRHRDVVGVLSADPHYSTLVALVQKAGLTEALASGNLTIFAPTNAAFAKLPPATLAAVGNDPALLKRVLLYHVIDGSVSARRAVAAKRAVALNGVELMFSRRHHGKVKVNGVNVIQPNIKAVNGVIHTINRVLIPAS